MINRYQDWPLHFQAPICMYVPRFAAAAGTIQGSAANEYQTRQISICRGQGVCKAWHNEGALTADSESFQVIKVER